MSRTGLKTRQLGKLRNSLYFEKLQSWPKTVCPVCTSKPSDISENSFDQYESLHSCLSFTNGEGINEQKDNARLSYEFFGFVLESLPISEFLKVY